MARIFLPPVPGLGLAIAISFCCSAVAIADEPPDDAPRECVTYVDPDQRDDSDILGIQGVTCFQQNEYEWALTHYQRAFSIDPEPALIGGIGRSLHELGLYEPAMVHYQRFLEIDPDSSRSERIRERIDELDDLLQDDAATVSLRSAPSGQRAYVVLGNGEWYELGETPLELQLRDGRYEFVFDGDHYRPRRVHSRVATGADNIVDEQLVSEHSALDISQRNRRRAGIWTAGSALVVGAAGATLLAISFQESSAAEQLERRDFDDLSDYDVRRRDHLDTASTTRRLGTVGTAIGATGLIVGSILYFSAPSGSPAMDEQHGEDTTANRWNFEPTLGFGSAGFRIRF